MDVMHGVASEASQIVTDGASCTLLSLLNEVNIDHRVCGVSGMGGSLGSQTCRLRKLSPVLFQVRILMEGMLFTSLCFWGLPCRNGNPTFIWIVQGKVGSLKACFATYTAVPHLGQERCSANIWTAVFVRNLLPHLGHCVRPVCSTACGAALGGEPSAFCIWASAAKLDTCDARALPKSRSTSLADRE